MTVSPEEIGRRADAEKGRTGPPEGFPALPEIPGGRYTSDAFLALENKHVLCASWVVACGADQVREPGQYATFVGIGLRVLIARGKDGVLRGFYNTCRHRGAPLVREACGKAALLRCQYHSWAYDLEGRLVAVPDERDFPGLNKAERGLIPVECEAWGDLVFVRLIPGGPSLRAFLGPLAEELSFLEGAGLRTAGADRYDIACNWKAGVDAFNEVYHIRTIHGGTGGQVFDCDATTISLFANGHARSVTRKTEEGRAAFDKRAKLVVPQIPRFYHENAVAYLLFPNTLILVDPTGLTLQTVWPDGVRKAHIDTLYLGLDWGDEPRPRFWDTYLQIMDGVWQEDIANLAPIQMSMDSGAFTGVLPNYQERKISWHHEEIDRRIGIEQVPAGLTVGQVLSGQVEGPISFR